jgi:hypothetical protein
MNKETILSHHQNSLLEQRFPNFELSYETISHKKVPPNYNLALAIPSGKKCYAWFSFHKNNDVLYILDINKEKRITKTSMVPSNFHSSLSLGTILYGVILPENNIFVIEDIYYFKGIQLKKLNFGEKLFYIRELLDNYLGNDPKYIVFALPVLWYQTPEDEDKVADILLNQIPYNIHHIQYRCLSEIVPYLNYVMNRKPLAEKEPIVNNRIPQIQTLIPDFSKPQYKYPAVFQINADIQFDIYHLYAYGKNKSTVYYNTAYIPNYKTSVFMNKLFRNIKENINLDYIEESDDEDDFEDMREDKYVDLQKTMFMECVFHPKFKRWTPVRVINSPCKIVHISQLVKFY